MLASGVQSCNFCESTDSLPVQEERSAGTASNQWRGELSQRLQSYRVRRRKPDRRQSALPFDENPPQGNAQVVVQETAASSRNDFAFTIAIGRIVQTPANAQVLIDVSNPPSEGETETPPPAEHKSAAANGALPVAAMTDRRRALMIDAVCLAFAYGSFLALFGSLGGQFTFSKLSAAVCVFTFAFVYVQYFSLFTVFGGSTPGMMMSGLQVSSTTGDAPTARQYMLRAAGYVLSAGTCFLGFLWVCWDEEELTWHDRISKTYLTNVEDLLGEESSHAVTAR